MKLKTVQIIILATFAIATVKAKADQFGSYCQAINGVERCTIWQWDSKAQKLIKKEIIRSSK